MSATVVAAALAWPATARAQDRVVPLVLQVPAATRALGMGNAYAYAQPDHAAIFYNPALLTSARGLGAGMTRFGSASSLFTAGGGAEWWRGGVGLGLQALSYGAPASNAGAFAEGESGLGQSGSITASETVVSAGYARTLFGFRLGLAGKLIEQRTAIENDVTVAADIGAVRAVGPVTLGLTVRNLGRAPSVETIDADLPMGVLLGASTQVRPTGPLDLMAAASAGWTHENQFAAGGGIEAAYWPISGRTFFGRLGYRWVEDSDLLPVTLGAGFAGDRIVLDYAFQQIAGEGAVHRFELRWR